MVYNNSISNCGGVVIKKCVALLSLCMAALLAGCSGSVPDTPSFSFSKNSSSSRSSSSADEPRLSDSYDSSESGRSEIPEPVETSEPVPVSFDVRKLVLSNDPINQKTIEINGMTAIVSGKTGDVPISHISVYPRIAEYELNSDDDGFFAEIVLTEPSADYLAVTLRYEDGHYDEVELEITPNGLALCDISEIVENNRKVVENAIEQPQNQVAEYIVKGGKPDEIREVLGEIQALSDEICEGLDDDYDKLRAISRWVSANIYYDYPAYDKGVPEETLSLRYMLDRHSSVCGGYSNMTSALCAAQGIKCWNVHGSVLTGGLMFVISNDVGEYHEWNFAEIDGRTIWVDSGWNSFCYLDRNGIYNNDGIYYRYFDIGEEYFALNHKAGYAEYRDYFALIE